MGRRFGNGRRTVGTGSTAEVGRPDYKIPDGRVITYIGRTPFEAVVTNWATNTWRRVA
jgi:hypothetical protein